MIHITDLWLPILLSAIAVWIFGAVAWMALPHHKGDFWVIANNIATEPGGFVLLPSEVKELAHRGEKDGRVSCWLQPISYDTDAFRNAWDRIGRGDAAWRQHAADGAARCRLC